IFAAGVPSAERAPVVLVTYPEPVVELRTHEGLRAFAEVKRWLDLSDEQTAEVTGIGRTTKYSWERGVVPRASTIRPLFSLRESLAGFVESKGLPALRRWLHQVLPEGRSPMDVLFAGESDAFIALTADELFSVSHERPSATFTTLEPDPDIEIADNP